MAFQTITTTLPLFTDSDYRYTANLQGQAFELRFQWNEKASRWHMSIRKQDRTPVILGLGLVAQFPMCADYTLEEFGLTGFFLILPVKVSRTLATTGERNNLAESFELFYIYETETGAA